MDAAPISTVCPACSAAEFRKVRARRWIAFSDDRICRSCGSRYAPPTPRWAGVVFVLIGVILCVAGAAIALLVALNLLSGSARALDVEIDLAIAGGLLVLGVASSVHGFRALFSGRLV
jgi:hypothetical protein